MQRLENSICEINGVFYWRESEITSFTCKYFVPMYKFNNNDKKVRFETNDVTTFTPYTIHIDVKGDNVVQKA